MSSRNEALLSWYSTERRNFPWRTTSEPWPILVSEIMSQQTQVSRIVPRFDEFLERFPTPNALASASVSETLAAWSGLGYNRRGLRLREAAQHIVATGWPTTSVALQRLPGVGPYTAAAVGCFAFGEQIAAVDTNLRRVLTRWRGAMMKPGELVNYANREIAEDRAGDWNQALMDLGALHCRPKTPACATCPVESWCTNPEAYEPPTPQPRFEGSHRQARGAVIKALLRGSATTGSLSSQTGLDEGRVEDAAQALVDEGIVTGSGASGWLLAD